MLLKPVLLSKSKSLKGYDDRIVKKPITYYLLSIIIVNNYREGTCSMLIALLIYNIILGKLWINKYRVLLDIMKDKILFVLDRYNYNSNKTSIAKDLAILLNSKSKLSIL